MKCHKCGKRGHKGKACFSRNNQSHQDRSTANNKARQVEEKPAEEEDLSEPEECRAVSSSKEVLFS